MLCGSCSFLLETDKRQCDADADCSARGLTGSVCVANLCQAISISASGGAPSQSPNEGTSGAMGVTASPPDAPQAGTNGASGEGAAVQTPSLATGGAAGQPAAAGTRAPAAAGSASAMSPCGGKGCGECTVDADCERRGVAGGTCIDTTCYPPMQECSADKDCEALGPEYVGGRCVTSQCRPNPKWRCEPTPQWPAAMSIKELSLPVIDALSLNPVADVHVVACNKLDYTCAMPVAEANSGKDGAAKLSVPDNFMGYAQETGRSDYSPAMYFLPPALPQDGKLPNFPLLPSGAIMNALAIALGASLDPMRGHMMLIADDCFGTTLPSVTFSSPQMDKMTVQFYVRDGVPNTTAKDTPAEGDGGYLNFPAGTALVTAKETKTGIELATVSVIVRPGFISVVYIRPMARTDH